MVDEMESLADYLRRTNPMVAEIMRQVRWQIDCYRTRRTVQIVNRKYRARKRRKR